MFNYLIGTLQHPELTTFKVTTFEDVLECGDFIYDFIVIKIVAADEN
jgi:hypothetical protein